MKRLLLLSLIIPGSLIATTGNAQVYVQARVSFAPLLPRVFCPPPPRVVVYNDPYTISPGYYREQECERGDVYVRGRGYEKVRYYNDRYNDERYYENFRRKHNRDYDRDDREYHHGHGWKSQRGW